jgi:hypothetical protein
MIATQLFGKHKLSHVIRVPDSKKVSVCLVTADDPKEYNTTSIFFESIDEGVEFAASLLAAMMREKIENPS